MGGLRGRIENHQYACCRETFAVWYTCCSRLRPAASRSPVDALPDGRAPWATVPVGMLSKRNSPRIAARGWMPAGSTMRLAVPVGAGRARAEIEPGTAEASARMNATSGP